MAYRSSYVIVADLPGAGARPPGRPHRRPGRRPGRHRLGAARAATRQRLARRRPWPLPRHRARHRPAGSAAVAVRYGSVAMLAGVLATSGWFTVSGATALAQMIQP